MKLIWHHNTWPWGKTVKVIKSDGSAIVEMSFDDNQPGVCYREIERLVKKGKNPDFLDYI